MFERSQDIGRIIYEFFLHHQELPQEECCIKVVNFSYLSSLKFIFNGRYGIYHYFIFKINSIAFSIL